MMHNVPVADPNNLVVCFLRARGIQETTTADYVLHPQVVERLGYQTCCIIIVRKSNRSIDLVPIPTS
jgi:hypothetical protein